MPGSGWVSLGFPATPGQMVGAVAVVATSDAAAGGAGIYELRGKDSSAVVEAGGGGGRRRLSQSYGAVASSISQVCFRRFACAWQLTV